MSQKKENRTDFKNASVGKVLFSGLVILAIVGGLWLLYSTTREGATRVGPVAGKAVGGFGEPHRGVLLAPAALAEGALAIDPVSGTAALPEQITVDVWVNPLNPPIAGPARFNNYKFTINFNSDILNYVSARNLVAGAGWTFSSVDNGAGKLTIQADSLTDSFGMTSTALVEITFRPKALFPPGAPITPANFLNINSYGPEGSSVAIISSYEAGTISIFNRWYPDADADGHGSSSDPGFVGAKPGINYVSDPTPHDDCDDNNPAVYPGASEGGVNCDGVDNNCDGSIDDEVLPICAVFGDGVQCGIHRVCNNAHFLDCNIGPDPDRELLDGSGKCNALGFAGNICNDAGQCVDPNAGCDVCPPEVVCPTCVLLSMPEPLTPGCGADADADGDACDYFETTTTCPTDCTACPGAVADVCAGVDSDTDGLSDAYETYLDGLMVDHGFVALKSFNLGSSDSDSDGVLDGVDFCPGTDVTAGQSVANGKINVNGCYAGDVGTENAGVRPDGCFSLKDSTFLIDYYVGRAPERACPSDLK